MIKATKLCPHRGWLENYPDVHMMRSTKRNRGKDRRPNATSDAEQLRMNKRTTVNESSDWPRQYPARVGFHGTDEETRLSPEE